MVNSDADTSPVGPFSPTVGRVRWFRRAFVLTGSWAVLGVVLTVATLFSLLTFRLGSSRYFHHVLRLVGRATLRIGGVRVRVRNVERFQGRRTRLVAFNHASQLDMFVLASLMPPGGTALSKKEMRRLPFIGWTIFAFDVPTVDRGNPEKARLSLAKLARKLHKRKATVLVSPEGTRSRGRELGPFKMGLFHLAAATKAPILPAVIRGAKECQPMGALVPWPGLVEVEFLPEISTADFEDDTIHEKRDALRQLYVEALERV